jgi:hypothetical protein
LRGLNDGIIVVVDSIIGKGTAASEKLYVHIL